MHAFLRSRAVLHVAILFGCAPRFVGDESADEVESSDEGTDESTGESTDESTGESTDESTGEGIEGIDGQVDTVLAVWSHAEPFVPSSTSPGTQLRIFGWKYTCGSDSCPDSDMFVIRELGTGELVIANFGEQVPTDAVLAEFGETSATFLAPFTLEQGDFGLCEPFDAGCGDGTFLQRGAVELAHQDGSARILSEGQGWAAAGYHVDVSRWLLGDASCQFLPWDGEVFIHRACEGECPAPDQATTCEPELSWDSFDGGSLVFLEVADELQGSFDAACEVLGTNADGNVDLDCVYANPIDGA